MKKEYDTKLAQIEDMEQTKTKLFDCFQNIIFHNQVETDEVSVPQKETLSKLIKAFHERDMRMRITELLKSVGIQRCVVSLRGLQTLGELIKYLLTAIIHKRT